MTLPAAVWDPTEIDVQHGAQATAFFIVGRDSVDDSTGIFGYCGARIYTLTDINDAVVDWASFNTTTSATAPGNFYLNVDASKYPSTPTGNVQETLKVVTVLEDWPPPQHPGRTDTIEVTIQPLTCDCSWLKWGPPAIGVASVGVAVPASATVVNPIED